MTDDPKDPQDTEQDAPLEHLDEVPEVKGYSTPPADDEDEPDAAA